MKKLSLIIGVVSILASSSVLAENSQNLNSGLVTLAANQTARINVLNTGSNPCTVTLAFFDATGSGTPVAASEALPVAAKAGVSFDYPATASMGIFANVVSTGASPDNSNDRSQSRGGRDCKGLIPTLEVLSGGSTVLLNSNFAGSSSR